MTLFSLLPYLNLLALIVATFIYWQKGGGEAEKKASDAYKDLADGQEKQLNKLKEQMTEMQNQITALSGKVSELTAVVREKDERIKVLESIDMSRNPVLSAFMTDVRNFMQNMNTFVTAKASSPNT